MREEEVTSERDQTVLNLIDGVETGEDEAAPVEEEPGHNCSYTVPLSAPGPQGQEWALTPRLGALLF